MRRLHRLATLALALMAASACSNGNGGVPSVASDTYNLDAGHDAAANVKDGAGASDSATFDAGGAKDIKAKDVAKLDTAKEDAGGGALSCKGKCTANFHPSLPCQCNDQCPKYGNCCDDWKALCKPKLNSCVSRCGKPPAGGANCGCQWNCGKAGSCCADYLEVCHSDKDLDWLKAKGAECVQQGAWFSVKSTKDGDTIVLNNGATVRFLVVNTPEIKSADCYAQEASSFTYQMMKKLGKVCLVKDPNQPDKDQYDRLLRYVYYKDPAAKGATVQLNARLVRLGYGTVFYPYAKGNLYEQISVLTQQKARQTKSGGWGKCAW